MIAFIDNVLYEALPYTLVGLGVVLTFRYLRLIDLTFAASFVTGPSIAGALLVNGVPFGVAIIAAIAAAVALAAATVVLMWLLEIEGLLAGLLTSFAGFAVALLFTQGTLSLHTVETPLDVVKAFDFSWLDGKLPLHPGQVALFGFLLLLVKALVDRFLNSELGLAFRAMEDERSRLSLLSSIGVSYWGMLSSGVVLGNILCTIAGTLVMLKEGQVTANRGFDVFIAVLVAYLFGTVLFERRPLRAGNLSPFNRLLSKLAVFSSTSATVLGILFYFALIAFVSRLDVPASVPKLLMIALVVATFIATRWSDIAARMVLARANRSQVVGLDAAFEAVGVHVAYPGFPKPTTVIRNAHLRLPPNTASQLRGANGSGKSTLLRYLAGRIPGKGGVSIPSPANTKTRKREKLVGYVSQDAHLGSCATLSVGENLALFKIGASKSCWRKWRAQDEETLPPAVRRLMAGADSVPAGYLSAGQRQVLNIAAMIVRKDAPRVVLFDEPLTHLDEENAITCVELVERLLTDGKTLLVVQHDVEPGAVYETSPARTRLARLMTRTIDLGGIEE